MIPGFPVHGCYIYDFLCALLVLWPWLRLAANQTYGGQSSLRSLMADEAALPVSYRNAGQPFMLSGNDSQLDMRFKGDSLTHGRMGAFMSQNKPKLALGLVWRFNVFAQGMDMPNFDRQSVTAIQPQRLDWL